MSRNFGLIPGRQKNYLFFHDVMTDSGGQNSTLFSR